MDVERTMGFILEQQAKTEANLVELSIRQTTTERSLDRLTRDITRLARLGVASRSKVNRRVDEHDKWMAEQEALTKKTRQTLDEIGEKLNALIGYVDRLPRNSA